VYGYKTLDAHGDSREIRERERERERDLRNEKKSLEF
jgi:hypothetical protein